MYNIIALLVLLGELLVAVKYLSKCLV